MTHQTREHMAGSHDKQGITWHETWPRRDQIVTKWHLQFSYICLRAVFSFCFKWLYVSDVYSAGIDLILRSCAQTQ